MNKRTRQYVGLLAAIVAYYFVHEGTHCLYALLTGTFKQINFIGLGVQVDIYVNQLSQSQLGVFCILGSVATLIVAYALVFLSSVIVKSDSNLFKSCMYYITISMLLIDPLYLSILCGIFGGGDMNGIALLIPEIVARILYGAILICNFFLVTKIVYPKYLLSFNKS